MSRYYNDELEHADREWKNHTYLKKYRGKNGKWVYVYKRKHNQVALNGNGGSTPDGSESATERISNSAHEALNRLRNKNSRSARTADIKMKSTISTAKRRVNNAIRAAGNTAKAVTKGLNDFANDAVNAQRDKNKQMERRRKATQRRRKRVIRATKSKLSTSYNNAKNKAVNKTVDYLDSLFR